MSYQLARFLESVQRPRIAVVGDVLLDEYKFGDVSRVSPEAPIPVLAVQRSEFRAGGAGSVVVNLARLDAEVRFFSVCGEDRSGDELRELLARENVFLDGLITDPQRRTTVKTRHLGFVQSANRAMQQILRVDHEDLTPIRAEIIEKVVAALAVQARDLDAVLISDYDKGLINDRTLAALRAVVPDQVPIIVDPARREDYSLYRGSFMMCPNRFEANLATDIPCHDLPGCSNAAEKLVAELELEAVALTMDADGIYLHEREGVQRQFPTVSRTVADVTGAGDMVLSVLGLVVAAGGTLREAVDLANFAAGLEVRSLGVTALTRKEILDAIIAQKSPWVTKVKSTEELVPLVEKARQAGRRVVFANGCFDLFHRGHLHLLHGASQHGEVLVVAINSDESVRRLKKGPDRPVVPEDQRLLWVACLEVVDYVICFDDDTPNSLLEALRPDVLLKGSEYAVEGAVGGEFVESYGGKVAYVPQLPGFSTTSLLERGPSYS